MRDLAKMEYISDMKASEQKAKLEIAKKLKIKGIPLELIAETTDLPISEIEKL